MTLRFDNPFADSGGIVRGERFLGRQAELQAISRCVLRPAEPSHLAIIGDARIGKSSLAYQAIMERKAALVAGRIIPVWINAALYDQASALLRALVTQCCDEAEDAGWMSDSIRRAACGIASDEAARRLDYSCLPPFFAKVRQSGIRIVFILDEFDHVRFLFQGDPAGFRTLRALGCHPEGRVTFVTTSRRTLRDIERQAGTVSVLDGMFRKRYLAMFDAAGWQAYLMRLSRFGIPVDASVKSLIDDYCGRHPFLLDIMGYEIVETFRERQTVDAERIAQGVQGAFYDQYERMTDWLREDGSLDLLQRILCGSRINVRRADALLRYGLIKASDRGTYAAYSPHFQAYLQRMRR